MLQFVEERGPHLEDRVGEAELDGREIVDVDFEDRKVGVCDSSDHICVVGAAVFEDDTHDLDAFDDVVIRHDVAVVEDDARARSGECESVLVELADLDCDDRRNDLDGDGFRDVRVGR